MGCQLFCDGQVEVVGISPDDSSSEVSERVVQIVNGVHQLLGTGDQQRTCEQVTVLDGYIGPGYGLDTPESKEANRSVATAEGIILDPVYTAKTMAALFDWISAGKLTEQDTVLFWHTGGQLAHFYAQI